MAEGGHPLCKSGHLPPTAVVNKQHVQSDNIQTELECVNDDYPATLLETLQEQRAARQHCDVVLHVDGQELHAHQCVLAANSAFFRSVFNQNTAHEPQHLSFPATPHHIVQSTLDYMYTGRIVFHLLDAECMLELCGILEANVLLRLCCKTLEKNISESNWFGILQLASKCSVPALSAAVLQYLALNFTSVAQDPNLLSFSLEDLRLVCKRCNDHGERETERLKFELILKWVSQCYESRERSYIELMQTVNPDYLHSDLVHSVLELYRPELKSHFVTHALLKFVYDREMFEATPREQTTTSIGKVRPKGTTDSEGKREPRVRKSPNKRAPDTTDTQAPSAVEADIANPEEAGNFTQFRLASRPKRPRKKPARAGGDESFFLPRERRPRTKVTPDTPRVPCPKCARTFPTERQLVHHMKGHGSTPSLCDVCGFTSRHPSSMRVHRKLHDPSQLFKCTWPGCSYRVNRRSRLDEHMDMHRGTNRHVCLHCGKSFYGQRSLSRHEQIHQAGKPFSCADCEFASVRKDKLKEHIKRYHPQKGLALGLLTEAQAADAAAAVSARRKPSCYHRPRCRAADPGRPQPAGAAASAGAKGKKKTNQGDQKPQRVTTSMPQDAVPVHQTPLVTSEVAQSQDSDVSDVNAGHANVMGARNTLTEEVYQVIASPDQPNTSSDAQGSAI